jgi:hypothetical protein
MSHFDNDCSVGCGVVATTLGACVQNRKTGCRIHYRGFL